MLTNQSKIYLYVFLISNIVNQIYANSNYDYEVNFYSKIYNNNECINLPILVINDHYNCKCNESNTCIEKYLNDSFKKVNYENNYLEKSCNFDFNNYTNMNKCMKCDNFSIIYKIQKDNYCFNDYVLIGATLCALITCMCLVIICLLLIFGKKIKKEHKEKLINIDAPPSYDAV